MIKIRYACLPEGLHATAVARGRHATIYLRPGLRPAQRRDALARLRRNARLGYAPPLPAAGVACALAADRIRRTLRDVRGALLCHPFGALGVAGLLAGAAVSYMTLMTTPLPAAGPLPVAAGDGETAAAGQVSSAGLPASALVPLGMKPRPWTVPEARPRHRRPGQGQGQGRYTWLPGPHPPAHRGPHRHGGSWWPRRRPGGSWPGRAGRGMHGWPPHHWRRAHGWPPARRQGAHRWPPARRQGAHGWPPHHWRDGTRGGQRPGTSSASQLANRQRPGTSAARQPSRYWAYYPPPRQSPWQPRPEWDRPGGRWR